MTPSKHRAFQLPFAPLAILVAIAGLALAG